MQKNSKIFLFFIMLSMFLSGILLPYNSFAYDMPTTSPAIETVETSGKDADGNPDGRKVVYICPNPDTSKSKNDGFTARFIPCIRDTIVFATNEILGPFSDIFKNATNALFVLAIAVWGVMLLGGNPINASQNGITLALKIGAVVMITNSFGKTLFSDGLYPALLDSVESMLNVLARPVANNDFTIWRSTDCVVGVGGQASEKDIMTAWNIIDCYLETLIGGIFSPTTTLVKTTTSLGILGFIVGAFFSGTVGVFIAFISFYLVFVTIMTVARCVYIFISSYIGISFMVLISPIIIPCILFASTKDLFDGWLRLILTFIIQPIFLFGYLVMFLVAFDTTIFTSKHSLYYAIAGDASKDPKFKIGAWLNGLDGSSTVYEEKIFNKAYVGIDAGGDYNKTGTTPDIIDTAVADKMPVRDPLAAFGLGTILGDPLHFFEQGKVVEAISWKSLAQKANIDGKWDAVKSSTDEEKEKFYNRYMIDIFFAFLMATIMMYIFYSLLNYIPFVGAGAMGHLGMMPTLGARELAPPGVKSQ